MRQKSEITKIAKDRLNGIEENTQESRGVGTARVVAKSGELVLRPEDLVMRFVCSQVGVCLCREESKMNFYLC